MLAKEAGPGLSISISYPTALSQRYTCHFAPERSLLRQQTEQRGPPQISTLSVVPEADHFILYGALQPPLLSPGEKPTCGTFETQQANEAIILEQL